jgi:hypothetical protein
VGAGLLTGDAFAHIPELTIALVVGSTQIDAGSVVLDVTLKAKSGFALIDRVFRHTVYSIAFVFYPHNTVSGLHIFIRIDRIV